MKTFDSATLERLYRSVSLAQHSGALRSPHGPLETTAWIHITAADLERLDDACVAVLTGDDAALEVLTSISRYDLPLVRPEPRSHAESARRRPPRSTSSIPWPSPWRRTSSQSEVASTGPSSLTG